METLKMVQDNDNTITDREYGALEQELKEVRHDYRNLRQIIEMSGITAITKEDVADIKNALSKYETQDSFKYLKELETEVKTLKTEFNSFKTKLYTIGAGIIMFISTLVWFVEFIFK